MARRSAKPTASPAPHEPSASGVHLGTPPATPAPTASTATHEPSAATEPCASGVDLGPTTVGLGPTTAPHGLGLDLAAGTPAEAFQQLSRAYAEGCISTSDFRKLADVLRARLVILDAERLRARLEVAVARANESSRLAAARLSVALPAHGIHEGIQPEDLNGTIAASVSSSGNLSRVPSVAGTVHMEPSAEDDER